MKRTMLSLCFIAHVPCTMNAMSIDFSEILKPFYALFVSEPEHADDDNERSSQENMCAQFFKAAKENDIEQLRLCLSKNIDVDMRNESNESALHSACEKGNIDIVRTLLDAGAVVDCKGFFNLELTPLIYALRGAHKEVVLLLLEKGADAKYCTICSGCSVGAALEGKSLELLKVVLGAGAPFDVRGVEENTPLHTAAHLGVEYLAALFEAGAQSLIDVKNAHGSTPLHIAAEHSLRADIVSFLLEHGADVNLRDNYNRSVLYAAVAGGNHDVVKTVLAAQPHQGYIDTHAGLKQTAYERAVAKGDGVVIQMLRDFS